MPGSKKLQVVVPIEAAREIDRLAQLEGMTDSAWLRRLILKALNMDGRGKKVRVR